MIVIHIKHICVLIASTLLYIYIFILIFNCIIYCLFCTYCMMYARHEIHFIYTFYAIQTIYQTFIFNTQNLSNSVTCEHISREDAQINHAKFKSILKFQSKPFNTG